MKEKVTVKVKVKVKANFQIKVEVEVKVKIEVKTNAILKDLLPQKNSNISLKILHISPFVHKYNEKS